MVAGKSCRIRSRTSALHTHSTYPVNSVNPVKGISLFSRRIKMKNDDLTQKVIGCAYKVHNTLGPGFLEKVYENALRIELERLGLRVRQQEPICVTYEGLVVGEYYADLWVDERVVVELKAAQTLVKQHEVQLVNYLAATGIES